MQKELDQLQKELDECKDKNDKLKAEIEKLAKLSDEELAKVNNLDTLKDGFDSLLNHELPPIEKGLDDLEKKLKNAVNRKKNGVKQDCLDSLNNDKIKLKQLDSILDKIEKEIIRIDDETENLERAYRYKDLERDHNLDDKIKSELKGQNEVLVDLKAARDDLKKTIADLENKID
jgi:chromosome segregation ATPase